MRFARDFQLYSAMIFYEKHIKSIASAKTVQKDTTRKETEAECKIKQENESGLFALGCGC